MHGKTTIKITTVTVFSVVVSTAYGTQSIFLYDCPFTSGSLPLLLSNRLTCNTPFRCTVVQPAEGGYVLGTLRVKLERGQLHASAPVHPFAAEITPDTH
jgi:hypothetical protein